MEAPPSPEPHANIGYFTLTYLLFNFLYYFTRISDGYRVRRNIFHHDATGSNYTIIADGHSRQNAYIATNPHIIADSYRTSIFEALVSLGGIDRMTCRIKATIRSDKHVVPKFYSSPVKYH